MSDREYDCEECGESFVPVDWDVIDGDYGEPVGVHEKACKPCEKRLSALSAASAEEDRRDFGDECANEARAGRF